MQCGVDASSVGRRFREGERLIKFQLKSVQTPLSPMKTKEHTGMSNIRRNQAVKHSEILPLYAKVEWAHRNKALESKIVRQIRGTQIRC